MAKKPRNDARASASARVVLAPPKGAVRVTVRVLRTGRTMRVSSGEARALLALKAVEVVDTAPQAPAYNRRDMVAFKPAAAPVSLPVLTSPVVVETKGDGEA